MNMIWKASFSLLAYVFFWLKSAIKWSTNRQTKKKKVKVKTPQKSNFKWIIVPPRNQTNHPTSWSFQLVGPMTHSQGGIVRYSFFPFSFLFWLNYIWKKFRVCNNFIYIYDLLKLHMKIIFFINRKCRN